MKPPPLAPLVPASRIAYGAALVFFGLQHFIHDAFVTRIVPSWPAWAPWPAAWPYAVGALLVTGGAMIMAKWQQRRVATVLGTLIFLSALLLHLPPLLPHLQWGGPLTNLGKALALGSGAWVVAASADARPLQRGDYRLVSARIGFGLFLAGCGYEHFLFAPFVQTLVPAWLPPGTLFWTYFGGVALIAGGAGLLLGWAAQWAAALTGGMIFAWIGLIHLPRALGTPADANESTALFEAIAMTATAWLLGALLARVAATTPTSASEPLPGSARPTSSAARIS